MPCPAVVGVVEKINEPRYPSFKGIMAAKKKPVARMSLAEAGIDPARVGLANAASELGPGGGLWSRARLDGRDSRRSGRPEWFCPDCDAPECYLH